MDINLLNIIVNGVSQVVTLNLDKDTTYHFTNRPSSGLLFAMKGSVRYNYNNIQYTSDENHALFIPQGITYSLVSLDKSSTVVINFNASVKIKQEKIFCFPFNNTSIASKLNRMDNLWTFKKTSYKLYCIAGIYEILANINEHSISSYQPKAKLARIKPSIDYIESHYTDSGLTNEKLAKISGVSTVYFRKLFTLKYGVPPMKYITIKRIEKAQNLLKSQYYSSITNVAEEVGFSCIYHFSRVFKQFTFQTPSEYARLCHTIEAEKVLHQYGN